MADRPTDDDCQAVAARCLRDAEEQRFVAAVVVGDNAAADEARQRAHEYMDRILDARAAAMMRVLAGR